jgi:hypothetical protein
MAYSDNLRIDLIATGTQAGVWGTTTNTNLGTIIEDAIAGYVAVSVTSANQAFTIVDGGADQARNAMIRLTTTTAANFAVYAPPVSKSYIIQNGSAYTVTIYNSTVAGNTTAAGAGAAIPAGKTVTVWSNGTDFSSAVNHASGTFSVGTDLSVGGASSIGGSQSVGGSQLIGGSQTVQGSSGVVGTLTTNSSAYLNGAATQTVDQTTAISTANETITLASAAFSNDLAVVLTSSGTMPTGLSTNTLYYVVETSATSYFSGAGSISGTTLTVSAVYGGSIGVGTVITGSGVATATVTSLIGGSGGVGTYGISVSQTVTSTTISGTYSGTQTIKLSATIGGSPVNITAVGSGNLTLTPVSIGITAPAGTSTPALATTAFVSNALGFFNATNWTIDETLATQTAAFTIASPAVVTVTTSPANGKAVSFSTTGALPTGITANTAYYVFGRTGTTYNLATTPDIAQTATITIATPGVVTVASAPDNGALVTFSTTGALPTGLTAGTNYYVVNRTSTTFQVSATSGGSEINTTGTQSGTQTATWRTLVNTSGTQSGTHTETTSTLNFKYKTSSKMSLDLGGNLSTTGNSGVAAASYGSSTAIPVLAINAQGQITSASTTELYPTSYSLASATGASVSRTVYLTAGTWQVVLDTRAGISDTGNYSFNTTQSGSVGATTVNTSIGFSRTGGAGYGRILHGSQLAVGTLTVAASGSYTLAMAAVSLNGASSEGSRIIIEKTA